MTPVRNFFPKRSNSDLKIAVNTRFLLRKGLEGYGWYTYEVFSRMCRMFPEDEYLFLFDRPYEKKFIFSDNIKAQIIPPPARHPVLFTTWFELSLPFVLNKYRPDIFISPDGFCSIRYRGKTLLIIHDLAYLHFPESIPGNQLQYYRKYMPLFIRRADQIVAISEATAADIERVGGVEAQSKTTVVYNGTRQVFQPLNTTEIRDARQKWTGGRPYFLFVGALQPRKNIARLLKAYELFRSSSSENIPLVLAGRMAWNSSELKNAIDSSAYRSDIILPGHIEESEINLLVGSAMAQVYVSLLEGFGLPVVEAFQAGVPVITSNISSMAEIGADAAYLVSPLEIEEIADAMKSIASNPELRHSLILKGLEKAKAYNWDKTAAEIHSLISK
jgi:glycosyltransferase involved in cell wall biosynthesis